MSREIIAVEVTDEDNTVRTGRMIGIPEDIMTKIFPEGNFKVQRWAYVTASIIQQLEKATGNEQPKD
jgi:hypothetical protein